MVGVAPAARPDGHVLDEGTDADMPKTIDPVYSSEVLKAPELMLDGLDFDALEKIHNATDHIPLVLHGGTGIPDDMIKKAISLGVSKINVNTECQLAFAKATREYIEAGKDQQGKGFDPRKLLAPGAEAIKNTVKEKMELFGSVGKA